MGGGPAGRAGGRAALLSQGFVVESGALERLRVRKRLLSKVGGCSRKVWLSKAVALARFCCRGPLLSKGFAAESGCSREVCCREQLLSKGFVVESSCSRKGLRSRAVSLERRCLFECSESFVVESMSYRKGLLSRGLARTRAVGREQLLSTGVAVELRRF